jgi:preprotein translocase subunit YajC
MEQFSSLILPIVLFVAILYFLMIRPQSKQQKERKLLLSSIRIKDKVTTIGGIHGTVTKVKEDTVIIRVAQNVEIEFEKHAVQNITNRNYKDSAPVQVKEKKANKAEVVEEEVNEAENIQEESPEEDTAKKE